MKYIIKSRGYGKTSDIVRLALSNNGIIIVPNWGTKYYIKCHFYKIYKISLNEIDVLTVEEYLKNYFQEEYKNRPIYIDEANECFTILFRKLFKAELNTIALTLS